MAPRRCARRYDRNSEWYDVAVVGAGPAGSAAARAAATAGLRVLLLDARTEIGRPVQCAEYVSRLIQREVSMPATCIAQRTETLRTHLPGGEQHVMAAPGYVLRRELFDQHFAALAESTGAELALGTRVLRRTPRGLVIRAGGQEKEISACVIVGADGAHSTVGRWIGQRNQGFVVAAQYELAISEASAETEVYLDPEYVGGYAWFFPKGETANVGVGVAAGAALSAAAALERFLDRLQEEGKIKDTVPHPTPGAQGRPPLRQYDSRDNVISRTGGFIPVGGLLELQAENVLLAGDAGGCVHPVTGAGILFAIISGRLAGEVAAKAIGAGDLGILAGYEARCRETIGGPIERGLAARGRLIEGWSDDAAALSELLRQNWIAFEGYGQFTTKKGG